MSARWSVRGIARRLLGRHVRRRADRRAELRERRAGRRRRRGRDGLRDAEVGDDRRAPGEEDVVRLDVAVHDAALVRVGERARDVAQDARPPRRSDSGPRPSRARRLSPSTNGIV